MMKWLSITLVGLNLGFGCFNFYLFWMVGGWVNLAISVINAAAVISGEWARRGGSKQTKEFIQIMEA